MNLKKEILRKKHFLSWWMSEVIGKKSTKEIYDAVSQKGVYDFTIDYESRVKRLSEIYKRISIKPKRILDLACGTGANIDALPWKKLTQILGVDITPSMLSIAKERFKNFNNITLRQQNFLSTSQLKVKYDLVTITYATRFVPQEKEQEFVNIVYSLLKPKGYFVIALVEEPWPLWLAKILTWIGLPRGYNIRMNYSSYLLGLFEQKFSLIRKVQLNGTFFVFLRHTGLILQKKPAVNLKKV